MAVLTMTLIHDKTDRPGAQFALKAAKSALGLLVALEKAATGKKRAQFLWDINIYSLPDRTVLEFTTRVGNRAAARKVAAQAAEAFNARRAAAEHEA